MSRAFRLSLLTVLLAPAVGATQPAVNKWRLVEDLRIGGADEGPKSFTEIRGIVATKAGTIFILDFKELELRVFDSKGTFLRVATRKGRGPGEILFPNGLAIGDDDVVVVSDPGNGRFSFYSPDGRFIRQVAIPITGYGDYWYGVIDHQGRVVDLPVRVAAGGVNPKTGWPETTDHIRRIRSDGKADTVQFPRCAPDAPLLVYRLPSGRTTSTPVPYSPDEKTVVTRLGTVWCTPSGDYRLFAGPIGGPVKEVVHKTVTPIPVSGADRRNAINGLARFTGSMGGKLISGDPSAIPRARAVITQLFADDQGRAWVRRTGMPDVTTAFDVFDATGREVAEIRSPAGVGKLAFVSGDMLITVLANADNIPVVVRYRIER